MKKFLSIIQVSFNYLFLLITLILMYFLIFLKIGSTLKTEIVIIGALAYVTLAYLYHHFDKSLTFEIIVEYILLAILAIIIILGQAFI